MNKYEKLIEYIINDNEQKASELFHEIVVEKSRDIYESLMDEEQVEENFGSADSAGEMIDHVADQTDETGLGEDDEEGEEFSLGDEPGEEDDEMGGEIGGDEAGEHGDIKADLEDIKDKIDQLLADVGGSDMDSDDEGELGDEFGDEEGEEEPFGEAPMMEEAEEEDEEDDKEEAKKDDVKESKSVAQLMREYVDTIGEVYGGKGDSPEGTEAGNGKKVPVNAKSISKNDGPDFGGTSKNILNKTGATNEAPDGKAIPKPSNEYSKGEGKFSKEKFQNAPGGSKKTSPVGQNWESEKGAEGQTTSGKVPVSDKTVLKQNTGK